jgi:hypothetical protein
VEGDPSKIAGAHKVFYFFLATVNEIVLLIFFQMVHIDIQKYC